MLEALELILWECDLEELVDVRIGGCQSRCEYGPNLLIFPGGHRYSHLTTERLRDIIATHIRVVEQPAPDQAVLDQAVLEQPVLEQPALEQPAPDQAMPE
jgi:(2Fe-2S) ferredoxin